MKKLILIYLVIFSGFAVQAQTSATKTNSQINSDTLQTVDASCGQCKFKLKGTGCNLAVRIQGKAYFVDGSKIDEHGDAHEDDGLCNKIRKATVSGKVVNDRFVATSFKLLPDEKLKR